MGCCSSSEPPFAASHNRRDDLASCGSLRAESYRRGLMTSTTRKAAGEAAGFSDVVSSHSSSQRSSRSSSLSSDARGRRNDSGGSHHYADKEESGDVSAPSLIELMRQTATPGANALPGAVDEFDGQDSSPAAPKHHLHTADDGSGIALPTIGSNSPPEPEHVHFARRSNGRRFNHDETGSRTSRNSRSSSRIVLPPNMGGTASTMMPDDADAASPPSQASASVSDTFSSYTSPSGEFYDAEVNLRDIHRPAGGGNGGRSTTKHGPRVPRPRAPAGGAGMPSSTCSSPVTTKTPTSVASPSTTVPHGEYPCGIMGLHMPHQRR